jgi:MFS family permease
MPIIGKLLIAFATNGWMLAGGRLVDRFGKGLRGAPRDALLADVVSEEQRGRAFGLHRTLDTAGAMVGVLAAAFAIGWFTNNSVGESATANSQNDFVYRAIIFVGAILGALSVALTWLIPTKRFPIKTSILEKRFQEPVEQEFHTVEGSDGIEVTEVTTAPAEIVHVDLGKYVSDFVVTLPRSYWRSMAALCLFALANSSDAFLLLRATDLGFSPAGAVTLYALYNLIYAAFSYPIGAISDRVGRRIPMVLGWGIYGAVYLGFALLTKEQSWAVWPLMASYGLYMAFTDGVGKAWIADLAPKECRGRSMGVYLCLTGLSTFLASLLMGLVWDRSGPFLAFLMGAVLALIAAFVLIFACKDEAETA